MFITKLKINFYDADPVGIMFFANIFRLAHSAYEEMLESEELERDYFIDEKYAIPILHSEVDFLKPIFPGSTVTIEISVSVLKESSFELLYAIKNDEGDKLAKVKTVHVFIEKSSWEKTPIPNEVVEFLLKHLER